MSKKKKHSESDWGKVRHQPLWRDDALQKGQSPGNQGRDVLSLFGVIQGKWRNQTHCVWTLFPQGLHRWMVRNQPELSDLQDVLLKIELGSYPVPDEQEKLIFYQWRQFHWGWNNKRGKQYTTAHSVIDLFNWSIYSIDAESSDFSWYVFFYHEMTLKIST